MLHTDLHNPQVKKRMTVDEFVKNNRGIDNGNDVPREFLEEVYTNIRDKKVRAVPLVVLQLCVSLSVRRCLHLRFRCTVAPALMVWRVCVTSCVVPVHIADPNDCGHQLHRVDGDVSQCSRRSLRH
jgi:hypothetical protein